MRESEAVGGHAVDVVAVPAEQRHVGAGGREQAAEQRPQRPRAQQYDAHDRSLARCR